MTPLQSAGLKLRAILNIEPAVVAAPTLTKAEAQALLDAITVAEIEASRSPNGERTVIINRVEQGSDRS
jgi:hypothetical protein